MKEVKDECLEVREAEGAGEFEPAENGEKCLEEYNRIRARYLALCRRYGLNPFDLEIVRISGLRLPGKDKTELVRLILSLIRLERFLKPRIGAGLFPLTVKQSERSGYLVPADKKA